MLPVKQPALRLFPSRRRAFTAALSAVGILLTAASAHAVTLSWDQIGNGTLGGTGPWDTTNTNWWNSTSDVAWTDTTGTSDIATFDGTAGTVTLGSNLGALGLVFNTTGYTIAGSTFTLVLGTGGIDASTLSSGTTTISGGGATGVSLGAAQTWNVGSGATLAVSSVVGGSGPLTKSGAGTLTLSGANTYTGATKVAGGTLQVTTGGVIANTGGGFLVGNTANTNAVLAIAGGSVSDSTTTGNAWASTINVGYGSFGRGFVDLSSGTLNARRQLFIGNSNGSTNGAHSAMSMSGGALNVGSYFGVGFNTNTYGVFNQTGGTVTQNQTSGAGSVLLGSGTGAFGVANLSGGSLTANGGIYVAENGTATGILNVSGDAAVTAANVGVRFGNNNAGSNGILNLLGGTITTNIVQRGNGTATFNFNGGTLKASGASSTFMTGLSNAYVHSGGGTIDNNGNGITIGQALLAPTGSGVSASGLAITGGSGYIDTPVVVVSGGGGTGATAVATVSGGVLTGITITNPGVGYTSVPTFTLVGGGGSGASIGAGTAAVVSNTSGGMTFSGSGTTTLTGVNTYTGLTTISAGTLALASAGTFDSSSGVKLGTSSSQGTLDLTTKSAFSFGSSQTVSGYGTINIGSGKTVTINGTLAPGNSPGIVSVTGSLALGGASTTNMEIAGAGTAGTDYDLISVSESLAYGGALTIAFIDGFTPSAGQSFDLFNSFTSQSGTFSSVTVAGTGLTAFGDNSGFSGTVGGLNYTFLYSSGDLTVAASAIPEPSTYAAIVGALALAGVVWQRRRRTLSGS